MLFKKVLNVNTAPFQRQASFFKQELSKHPIIQARANAPMAEDTKASVPVVSQPFDPASIKPFNPNLLAIVPVGFWNAHVLVPAPDEPPVTKYRPLPPTPVPTIPGYNTTFVDNGNLYSLGKASNQYEEIPELNHEYAVVSDVPVESKYAHLSTFKQKEDTATTASAYERLRFSPREQSVSPQKAAAGYEQWAVPGKN